MGSTGGGGWFSPGCLRHRGLLTDDLMREKSFIDLVKITVRASHIVRLGLKDDEVWEQKAGIWPWLWTRLLCDLGQAPCPLSFCDMSEEALSTVLAF